MRDAIGGSSGCVPVECLSLSADAVESVLLLLPMVLLLLPLLSWVLAAAIPGATGIAVLVLTLLTLLLLHCCCWLLLQA